jgi:anti-anti-sigma factor
VRTGSALPSCVAQVDRATGHVTVTGRLDGAAVPAFHEAVSTLLRAGRASWRIDVSALEVADDAGLRALVGAYRRALRHGCQLTLSGASPPLHRALVRLRLARHLLPGDDDRRPVTFR